MSDLTRRVALGAVTLLPFAASMAGAVAQVTQAPASRTLVAYFSRTGNTRVIAGQICRAHAADLFEIVPATPYPEDYEDTVSQAQREREAGFEPPLRETVRDIASYDTIFLGFPIWGTTAPAIVRTFLSNHDLSGKILIPFITHGGYGPGSSLSVVREHAPNAKLLKGFTLEADQERRTLEKVNSWLGGLPL